MNVKKIEPKHSADCNDEVIAAWKKAYPRGIFRIAVNNEEVVLEEKEETDEKGKKHKVNVYEQKVGFVRKPTREEISAAMTLKNDPMGQVEDLLRSCWLGGDTELLDDDDYFQGAVIQFQEVMTIRTGEVKKV